MESVQAGSSNFSDSDCEDFIPLQSKKILNKLAYTSEEDRKILKFVLENGNIYKTGSISLWKKLEYKMDKPKRTYQSLKNRFLRNIKPNIFRNFQDLIPDYETEQDILKKFPELEDSFKKYLRLRKNKALDVCSNEENVETGAKQTKNLMIVEPDIVINPYMCDTHIHERQTVVAGDSIKVIVNIKPNVTKQTSKHIGIFKKSLNPMAKLIPCSCCGGTGIVNSSILDCSHASLVKKSNFQIDEKSPNKKQHTKLFYKQESTCSGFSSNLSSASEEKSTNSSQNIISDKELEILYEETVANRHIFMDSVVKKKK